MCGVRRRDAVSAGKPKHVQFWQAAAAITCSRAFLEGVRPPTQPLPTQVVMRLESAWFAALAAQLAAGLGRADTLCAAAQCAWNACCGCCDYAALRGAFVGPLTLVCRALQAGGDAAASRDRGLDARVNGLLCACLLSAGRPQDACAHARSWPRLPAHRAHTAVWGWLFEVTRVPEVDGAAATNKLGMYSRAFQAVQWLAAARVAPGQPEQRAALERACKAAAVEPVLTAEVQLAFAEWLLACGGPEVVEQDVAARVVRAAAVLVQKDYTSFAACTLAAAPLSAPASASGCESECGVAEAAGECGGGPVSALRMVQEAVAAGRVGDGARMDVVVRVCVLASLAAEDAQARLAWLLCAQACVMQMAAGALHGVWLEEAHAAAEVARHASRGGSEAVPVVEGAAGEGGDGTPEGVKVLRGFPAAPRSLWEWLELRLTQEQLRAIAQAERRDPVGAGLDVTAETVPWPEQTLAWLECLARQLRACGCTAHTVPVRWLQCVVAARLVGSGAHRCFLALLGAALTEVGFAEEAEVYLRAAGVYSGTMAAVRFRECAGRS